jgi:hypothetical protein
MQALRYRHNKARMTHVAKPRREYFRKCDRIFMLSYVCYLARLQELVESCLHQ